MAPLVDADELHSHAVVPSGIEHEERARLGDGGRGRRAQRGCVWRSWEVNVGCGDVDVLPSVEAANLGPCVQTGGGGGGALRSESERLESERLESERLESQSLESDGRGEGHGSAGGYVSAANRRRHTENSRAR